MSKRLIIALALLLVAGGLMASSRALSHGPAVMAGHMAAQNGTCTGSGNGDGACDGCGGTCDGACDGSCDGTCDGSGGERECHEGNNTSVIRDIFCMT